MVAPKYHCSQCNKELTEKIWANYYGYEWDTENILCGDGDCWAEWMQNNTFEHEIEQEEE